MKSTLVFLLLVAGVCSAKAQSGRSVVKPAEMEHSIYVDLSPAPGISATYTWNFGKHFDMGAGLCYRYFKHEDYGSSRSAVYLDLRPHWGKKSQFFLLTDLGLCLNGGPPPYWGTISPLGVYIALGPGYCYKINRRGMGPYLSLGIDTYSEVQREKYSAATNVRLDGRGVFCLGFKF